MDKTAYQHALHPAIYHYLFCGALMPSGCSVEHGEGPSEPQGTPGVGPGRPEEADQRQQGKGGRPFRQGVDG